MIVLLSKVRTRLHAEWMMEGYSLYVFVIVEVIDTFEIYY